MTLTQTRGRPLRVAMLAPIAWRVPPRHYGPWERVVSLLTEELVRLGVEVTLFATADSLTTARLSATAPGGYEETPDLDVKVEEALHLSSLFGRAAEFDLIHNHADFLPLSYAGLVSTPTVTTIHGFSGPRILPVYRQMNGRSTYVSISNADRHPELSYAATIYHGLDLSELIFDVQGGEPLVFFGRMHRDKGAADAVRIARAAGGPCCWRASCRTAATSRKKWSRCWGATCATWGLSGHRSANACWAGRWRCYTRFTSTSRSG